MELGGWDVLYAFGNPPPSLLEKEVSPFPDWLLWHCLISPKLELHTAEITKLSENTFKVRLVVHNTGWLPTNNRAPAQRERRALGGGEHAQEKKLVRGVVCEIELPEGATLETGKHLEERGQLEGRAHKPVTPNRRGVDATEDRLKVEWIVRTSHSTPASATINLTARHDRAGLIRTELTLP